MSKFLVLLHKELKNMRNELFLVLGLQIGYVVINLILRRYFGYEFPHRPSEFHKFIMDAFEFSPFLFAAILVYSLYMEERTGTIYQACSLPIKRNLLRSKFMVVLGGMIFLVMFLIGHTLNSFRMGMVQAAPEVAILGIIYYFSNPYITLCLVCLAWGCMQRMQKNRLVAGLVSGVIGFGVYIWLMDVYNRNNYRSVSNVFIYDALLMIAFIVLIGLMFAGIGFFMYERYSEV